MTHYRYLIIGGGMTAHAAATSIRRTDRGASIGIIGAEPDPPYNRPPLSKGLWKGKPLEKIWRPVEDLDAVLHLRRTAADLDPASRRVTDGQGDTYTYDRLLLATGGTPRELPFGGDSIIYFRTLQDYRKLRELADGREHFGVVGGGFIGSEIAAALAMNGKRVTMLFPEEGIGARTFPPDLTRFLNDYYREKGVDVRPGASVEGLERQERRVSLRTGSGRFTVDAVVAGLGIRPNTELAERAGLDVDNGIVVDRGLRTSHEDIFAAGDVAAFYNPALEKRLRVEHEDNANTMGDAAGRALVGEKVEYDHLPFFYSDLFELGYEAVGEVDSRLDVVTDWQEPFRKGILYYLRDGRVRGVLLWDVWGKVDAARELIAQPGPFTPADLQGRIGH